MAAYRDELQGGLASLIDTLRTATTAGANLRLAVLGFSDDVQSRLDLSDVREASSAPLMQVRGVANYRAVFEYLLRRIPADSERLRNEGHLVYRPVVYFVSKGQPTDASDESWHRQHAALVDRSRTRDAPNIVAFGIGAELTETMFEVATDPGLVFVAERGTSSTRALRGFLHSVATSLIPSGQTADAVDSNATVSLGVLLAEAGREESAETWWRRGADAGQLSAMFNLGSLLNKAGRHDEALAWLQKAAEAGHADAMTNLGSLLSKAGRHDEALAWLQKAAEAGHADAMTDLRTTTRKQEGGS
ncbi:tetratricopeptide repeat protein [Nocardia cerradoensis]|nr:tetratricopeptide repeat protein [Nocardia cerradoensis]